MSSPNGQNPTLIMLSTCDEILALNVKGFEFVVCMKGSRQLQQHLQVFFCVFVVDAMRIDSQVRFEFVYSVV
jgi:hypothetical protein